MLLVDERRCAFGIDPALVRAAGGDEVLVPAALLADFVDLRVVSEGERRAIVRRVAATRPELGVAAHLRRSPSFAARVLAALDGSEPLFAELTGEVRTLLAFANAVDVRAALGRALEVDDAPLDRLAIDAALLAGDDAFAWRRLASAGGFRLDTVELGPIGAPALDRVAVASIVAFLRFAGSERDEDARDALRSKLAPIDPDDARTLLAAAGDAANILDVIDAGAAGNGREFAHALRSIARAYRVPDAGLGDVLGVIVRVLAPEPAVANALARIARDFDAARAFAPAWEAADAIDEIAAELDGVANVPISVDLGTPAAIVPPEPGVPVTSRRATFSASSLNAFAECERKWFFRYVCSAVEDRGSSASFYGIAFHAALEDFHGTHTRFEASDAASLAAVLDFAIVASFDRHRTRFDAPVEFELQKRRARRTGKRYIAWLIERAKREPFTVVGCETGADVQLGGYSFIGYIDRLDRDDASGGVTVVDYKTGAIAKSAGEYLADVIAFRDFQLPFYYWARTAAGDRVTRLALVPLKDAMLDVAPIELTIVAQRPRTAARGARSASTSAQIGVPDLERAREKMIELAALLAKPTLAHYAVTDDADDCRYCAYSDACRERPAVAEERFGR
jgi:RecB family exonuclease